MQPKWISFELYCDGKAFCTRWNFRLILVWVNAFDFSQTVFAHKCACKIKNKRKSIVFLFQQRFQFIRCPIWKCINCFCCDYSRSLNFIAKLLLSTIFSTPENNDASPAFQLNCDWLLSLKYDFFIMKSKQNFRNDCHTALQRIQMKRQKSCWQESFPCNTLYKVLFMNFIMTMWHISFQTTKTCSHFLANFAVEQSNNWQMKVHL